MFEYYDFAIKKSHKNCITCKHSGSEITCSCGIAFYCTVDCQSRNVDHCARCSDIQQLMKECANDYKVIPKSSTEHLQSNEQTENRKKWEELLILLIKESKSNYVSLRLTFYLLQMLMRQNPDLYRSLIVLLPEVALMLNELEFCHNLISRSCLEKRFLGGSLMVERTLSPTEIHKPLYALLCHDSDPTNCDKILVLNLLMVKLVFVQRIRLIQQLRRQWNSSPLSIFDLIGDFLGVPKEWKKVRSPILERQCMDMIKLLHQVEVNFIPFLLRSCQSSNLPILLRVLRPSSSTETLRYWFFLCRLCSNRFVLEFLKEVSADVQSN
jgi:hypothetical protein